MLLFQSALVAWLLAQFCAGSPQNSILQSEILSAPALTQPTGSSQQCTGCYVVADVAGIVFGSEVINQTVATAVVSVVAGLNGTTTTTSFIAGSSQFTFAPTGLIGTQPALGSTFDFGSTIITVSGATLTSPTAYNVFTAFSVTSSVFTDGSCVVFRGAASPVPGGAFSVAVPQGAGGAQFNLEAESSFITHVGYPTCNAGGENPTLTSQIPVANVTSTTTTTVLHTFTPQPALFSTITGPSITSTVSGSPTVSSTSLSLILSISSAAPTFSSSSGFLSSSQLSSSPNFQSQAVPGAPGGPIINSTSALTSTVSVETVVIIGVSTTATATLTTPLPVVIVGNSTSALAPILPTGGSPNVTIIPFLGKAPSWNRNIGESWILWGAGVTSLVLAIWVL